MSDECMINAAKRNQTLFSRVIQDVKATILGKKPDHQQPTTKSHDFALISAEPSTTETTSWDSAVAILNIRP